jgi:hypothetical protein
MCASSRNPEIGFWHTSLQFGFAHPFFEVFGLLTTKPNVRFIMRPMDTSNQVRNAAKALAKRSIEARKQAWGEDGFRNRMRKWGKMGGRPRGSGTKQTKGGGK